MKRRQFIRGMTAAGVLASTGCVTRQPGAGSTVFRHGVASGDPLADRVILWSRVSPAGGSDPVDGRWRVSRDPELRDVVTDGAFSTSADRDFTVKVDATGLPPASTLYYRFETAAGASPVGRTRTLPDGPVERIALGVASCSNHPAGYFHAYRDMAAHRDLDAVLHLGDYIYEYGIGEYATHRAEALGRIPDPLHETLSLADYRRRHAQYKADPDLQALHATHPVIAILDDHEVSNDFWRGGAENHQDGEGRFDVRVRAALQAYYEWMPIRGDADGLQTRSYRQFEFGDLATLAMLDTRLLARDRQPDAGADTSNEAIVASLRDPSRGLLGAAQQEWLQQVLGASGRTTWQLVGQQVLMTPVHSPSLEPLLDLDAPSLSSREFLERIVAQSAGNPPLLLDTWDGYPVARERFLGTLRALAANPVVISGDLHTALAGNLVPRDADSPAAVEFMTPSITSPGFTDYLPERRPNAVRDATLQLNPALRYMETARRGWLRLDADRRAVKGSWRLLDSVQRRHWRVVVDRELEVRAGEIDRGLSEAGTG